MTSKSNKISQQAYIKKYGFQLKKKRWTMTNTLKYCKYIFSVFGSIFG